MLNLQGLVRLGPGQESNKVESFSDARQVTSENVLLEVSAETNNSFDTYLLGLFESNSEPEYVSNLSLTYSGSFFSTLQALDYAGKKLSVGAWFDTETKTLSLSRDLYGAIPIFYYHAPGQAIHFSTSLASLVRQIKSGRRLELNQSRILAHLGLGDHRSFSEDTFYAHIRCVPPGHVVEISPDGIRTKCYISFRPEKWNEIKSLDEAAEILFDLLKESVSAATSGSTDKPFSSHLSGGLDSSSISALIRHIHPDRAIHTLHSRSKFADSDESPYARAVAEKIHSTYHEVFQSEDDFGLIRFQTPLYAAPVIAHLSTSSIVTMLMRARDLGSDIMLTGQGGDSIIGSGFEVFGHAFDTKNWPLLQQLIEKRVPYFSQYAPEEEQLPYEQKLFLVKQYYYYNRIAKLGRGNWKRFAATYMELARNVDLSHIAFFRRALTSFLNRSNRPVLPVNRTLAREELIQPYAGNSSLLSIPASLRGNLGSQYTDLFNDIFRPLTFQSSANIFELGNHLGIASRAPMRNKQVLEFCMAVPDHIKYGQGRGREHFRMAMKGLLPYEVYDRVSKASLSSDYGQDMTSRMWSQAKESVMDSSSLWGYVDRKKLEQELSILYNPKVPFILKSNSWALLTKVVTLSAWLDWLDGQ